MHRAAHMQDFMDAACLAVGVSIFTAMDRDPNTRSLCRLAVAVSARRLAIYLARKHGDETFSFPHIARYFECKSHSSICGMHGYAKSILEEDGTNRVYRNGKEVSEAFRETIKVAELILCEMAKRAA